ncbi:MAG: Crp/Fnr family transcriptional regulator [Pyramidobacter sp.]|uniref:Crp/Fnr family transcriptional regulator n=1 Tax=Pyramidobacter sp. TaxID=1943581 RepID=UPI002A82F5B3|nr:Crp/Fnr family transcriptional regulator [Pyramidobacter sp.]MDY4033117.1 Crp/Fnr family transcriptional regulator [Pyramidobacter sp.]
MFIQKSTYQFYRSYFLKQFSAMGTRLTHHRKDIIELSGNPVDYIYLISTGYVAQYFVDALGHSMILLLLAPGNIFNEVTFLNMNSNCVASVAHTEAELIKIHVKDFQGVIENNMEVYKYLSYQIAYKLRLTMAQMYDLSFHGVEQRLRNLLLRLCIQIGESKGNDIRFPCYLTHEELAQMISSTRSTVSRLMKTFQEKGYICLSERNIVIKSKFLEKNAIATF